MSNKLTATDYKKKEAREHRKKEYKYNNKLKNLFPLQKNRWVNLVVEALDKNGEWTTDPERIEYYARMWRAQRSKDIKKDCNRKVRHSDPETAYQNGEYKKIGEFWWELD